MFLPLLWLGTTLDEACGLSIHQAKFQKRDDAWMMKPAHQRRLFLKAHQDIRSHALAANHFDRNLPGRILERNCRQDEPHATRPNGPRDEIAIGDPRTDHLFLKTIQVPRPCFRLGNPAVTLGFRSSVTNLEKKTGSKVGISPQGTETSLFFIRKKAKLPSRPAQKQAIPEANSGIFHGAAVPADTASERPV